MVTAAVPRHFENAKSPRRSGSSGPGRCAGSRVRFGSDRSSRRADADTRRKTVAPEIRASVRNRLGVRGGKAPRQPPQGAHGEWFVVRA